MALLTQVRDGLFAKVAMHAVRQLALQTFAAHASPVAALPSRAQDRRPDPRARARPQRHRGAVAALRAAAHPDGARVRAGDRHPDLAVRLALCRGRAGDGRDLSRLHLPGDRVAHRDPQAHERVGYRRQHQGGRLAPELRDREVFRRRGARDRALRPLDGALRARLDRDLHLACRAQRRPGGDLHGRHDDHHGACRRGHHGRAHDDRQLRPRQRHAGPALHPAELHGHALPRDQAGADRHRRHVLDHRAQPRDRGPAGREAARRHGGPRALRGRALRLCAGARDPEGRDLRGAAGAARSPSSARPAPASRRSRASCSASTSRRAAAS